MIAQRLALAALLVFGVTAQIGAVSGPVVGIASGAIRGVTGSASAAFLGIPFAAPPVGAARWQAPRPVRSWRGVRDATHFAQPCATEGLGDGPRTTNEDCLYLNVYAPKNAKRGDALPVMIFIHGGGNLSGSTTIYDGSRMAEVAHAVVVMPAYRLGVFSSLALPGAGRNGATFIIQDNLAALRWVRRNIAAFGGSPHDVTVSGESSGGTDVCDLLAAPAATGLFRQAIVQSGLCEGGPFEGPSLAVAQAAAASFATAQGCTGANLAGCLRAKPPGKLIDAWKAPSGSAYGTGLSPMSTASAFASGRINRVPVLIGFNRDEWRSFEHALYPLSAAGLQHQFGAAFGDRAPAVASRYPASHFAHREDALGAAVGDSLIVCPSIAAATALSRFVPVSVYEFADRTAPAWKSLNPALAQPRPAGYSDGASHTAELQYLYAYRAAEGPLNGRQRRLGDTMIARWVAFGRAKPGTWPAFTQANPVITQIGADGSSFVTLAAVEAEHHCDFWNRK